MENIIEVLVLAVLMGGAAAYLVRAKRSGVKCVCLFQECIMHIVYKV